MTDIENQAEALASALTWQELYALRSALTRIARKRERERPRRMPEYVVRVPRLQVSVTLTASEIVDLMTRGD